MRRYLAEFLSDPRVIDINPVGRWLLLHLIILRTRPAKSAHAYRSIWTERGSPLLHHSRDLAAGVQAQLPGWKVALGMRYGTPSIAAALDELAGCEKIVAIPLFPQYASSSTGSALERLYQLAGAKELVPPLAVASPFHADPGFVAAFAAVGKPAVADADRVLFSFHGVPERHIRRIHPDCFDAPECTHPDCYRGQCQATAHAIAAALGLEGDRYTIAFQSRLGRTPWIRPYTDHVIGELAAAGVKRLAVFCPAFVADCLETLEEIGIRARDQFRAAGGDELTLVPSLNAHPAWVDAVVAIARRL